MNYWDYLQNIYILHSYDITSMHFAIEEGCSIEVC
jgi:hypothetical protein